MTLARKRLHSSINAVKPTHTHTNGSIHYTEHSNAFGPPLFVFPAPVSTRQPRNRHETRIQTDAHQTHTARLPIHSVCLCTRRAKHIKAILIVCANLKIRPQWKRTQNAAGNAQQQQRHHPLGRCHVRIHFEGQQKHTGDDYDYDSSSLAAIRTHFTQFFGWLLFRLGTPV